MPDALPPCSILILAGGRGQRMGGRDKGLVDWQGEPLIAHVHRAVRPLSDDLVISCNRNQAAYQHTPTGWWAMQKPTSPGRWRG